MDGVGEARKARPQKKQKEPEPPAEEEGEEEGDVAEELAEALEEAEIAPTKGRRGKSSTSAKEVKKALADLKKRVAHMKKRVNVKTNLRFFEESARDPRRYDELLEVVAQLASTHAALVDQKKKAQQPRYLRPEVRRFVAAHPLSVGQPPLPRLSKGKGVGTKQMLYAYLYGYLGDHCTKTGAHTYVPDAALAELVLALTGEERAEVGFSVVPTLVTRSLLSGVAPLEEDVGAYSAVLAHFARLRKSVPAVSSVAEDGAEGEEK